MRIGWIGAAALLLAGCKGEAGSSDGGSAAPTEAAKPVAVAAEAGSSAAAPEAAAKAEDDAPEAPAEDRTWLDPPSDLAAAPSDAGKHAGGIKSRRVKAGDGDRAPQPDDTVWLQYTAWSESGDIVDSSVKRGAPKKTRVKKLSAGWKPVVEAMRRGERRRAWIPEKLAYTASQRKRGLKGTLVVDFELLELAAAPAAPADVKAPPKDALLTVGGVAYRFLERGDGEAKPTATSEVAVRYSGWHPHGECFDFTPEGESTRFRLDAVIPGWTETLQLMAVGDKVRMWIPEKLAYAGQKGKPEGTLVFDVELLEIGE